MIMKAHSSLFGELQQSIYSMAADSQTYVGMIPELLMRMPAISGSVFPDKTSTVSSPNLFPQMISVYNVSPTISISFLFTGMSFRDNRKQLVVKNL